MEITIPAKYDTPEKQWAYCKRAKRIFIEKVHNVVGKWYREGLSQAEYDALPLKIRNRMPYRPQITQVMWAKASDELEKYLETRIEPPLYRFGKEVEYSTDYDSDIDKEDLVD